MSKKMMDLMCQGIMDQSMAMSRTKKKTNLNWIRRHLILEWRC